MSKRKMTLGLIVGNRGFFPDHLAKSGREEMLRVLGGAGIDVVTLSPEESKYGAVETREESKRALTYSSAIGTVSTVCWSPCRTLARREQ